MHRIISHSVTNTAISNHNMIYCTRKIVNSKYNKHKELTFYSLRNYSVDIFKQVLERAAFPNYDIFHNPDFVNRLTSSLMGKLRVRYIRVISYTKHLS